MSKSPKLLFLSNPCLTNRALNPRLTTERFDILVVPGDLGCHVEYAIPLLASLGKPVIVVLGNKDLRRFGDNKTTLHNEVKVGKRLAEGTSVHLLEKESIIIQGVRFIGLHYGFGVHDHHPVLGTGFLEDYNDIKSTSYMDYYQDARIRSIADQYFRDKALCSVRIASEEHPDNPVYKVALIAAAHQVAKQWLLKSITPYAGPTVIVTHGAPSTLLYETPAKLNSLGALSPRKSHDHLFVAVSQGRDCYEQASFALNTNKALLQWAGHIWAYGQSKVNAMGLDDYGTVHIACGEYKSDCHPFPPGPATVADIVLKANQELVTSISAQVAPVVKGYLDLSKAVKALPQASQAQVRNYMKVNIFHVSEFLMDVHEKLGMPTREWRHLMLNIYENTLPSRLHKFVTKNIEAQVKPFKNRQKLIDFFVSKLLAKGYEIDVINDKELALVEGKVINIGFLIKNANKNLDITKLESELYRSWAGAAVNYCEGMMVNVNLDIRVA